MKQKDVDPVEQSSDEKPKDDDSSNDSDEG